MRTETFERIHKKRETAGYITGAITSGIFSLICLILTISAVYAKAGDMRIIMCLLTLAGVTTTCIMIKAARDI